MLRTLGNVGDRSAKPGSRDWALAVRLDIQANLHQWSDDVKTVKAFIELMIRHEGWRTLEDRRGRVFSSFADFCKEREPYGLGHDPDLIDAIKGAKNGTSVGRALGEHGGDRKSEAVKTVDYNQADDCKVDLTKFGNSAAYTLARLDRDAPELAERVRKGELSANAAAIEAGFRKKPTAIALLRAAWRKADDKERREFLTEVNVATPVEVD